MQNLFKGIILSFYSREFYSDLAHRWKGIGFGFILIAALMETGFALIAVHPFLHDASERLPQLADTLPVVVIKEGKLSIDKPVPYSVVLNNDPLVLAIIDTNYKTTDIDALKQYMKKNNVIMLVTEDKFITLKNSEDDLDIKDINSVTKGGSFTIDHEAWQKLSKNIDTWMMPVIIITSLVITTIGALFLALVRAVVIKLLGLITKTSFDYAGAIRIAAALAIPVCVLENLLPLLGVHALKNIAEWVIVIGYMIFATLATKLRDTTPI